MYLGIEESYDIQHKNEKGKLKKEYLKKLRLVLVTELSANNKIQAIQHWQYQYLDRVSELLTSTRETCKN